MDDLFPQPGPADDVYFCLRPDETTAAAIAALAKTYGVNAAVRRTTLHLSLLRLGALPGLRREDLEAAVEAAHAVSRERFAVHLVRFQSWRGTDAESTIVLLARPEDDTALQWPAASIGRAVARAGVRAGGIPPQPHLTIAYDPVTIPATALASPIAFTAEVVHLVRNRRGKGKLEELARYCLR